MNRKTFLRFALLALLLGWAGTSAASCGELEPQRLALPAGWVAGASNPAGGIVTFRAANGPEALTVATYRVVSRDDPESIARLAAEHARAAEREAARGPVSFAPADIERNASAVRVAFEGTVAAEQRRFASLTVADGCTLRHYYYEAIGLSAAQFGRQRVAILGGIDFGGQVAGHAIPDLALPPVPRVVLPGLLTNAP